MPKLYSEIKKNDISSHFPDDLIKYLKEIYKINKRRNNLIFKQISHISEIFNKKNIRHVLLKGSAFLVIEPYDSRVERMIGDIDILVSKKDLLRSFDTLLRNGYSIPEKQHENLTKDIDGFGFRHLSRIINNDYIAAVELHSELLLNEHSYKINPEKVLIERKNFNKKFHVPSDYFLWKHSIMNSQINDHQYMYNNLCFKTVLDVISIEPDNVHKTLRNENEEIIHFYSLLSVFYDAHKLPKSLRKTIYIYKLNFALFGKLFFLIVSFSNFVKILYSRVILIFTSNKYRKRIMKNPNQVLMLFYQKLFPRK